MSRHSGLTRCRLRGGANPLGMWRDAFSLHHDGERAELREVAYVGVIQDGGASADGHALPHIDSTDLHHSVFIKMRLQRRDGVDRGEVANLRAVEFRNVRRIHEHTLAELRAE